MKDKFKSFYQLDNEELKSIWSDKDTVFIFDTNILLNLYQYSQETREEFYKVLEAINERIWIPFHVALEYQRRRLNTIKNEKKVFNEIFDKLKQIVKILDTDFNGFKLKDRNPDLNIKKDKFKKDILVLIENFRSAVEEEDKIQPCVRSDDEIRSRLDDLFEGKVGNEPSEEFINKINVEGEDRYKKKIPPGYKDIDKAKNTENATFLFNGIEYERKYGDLIIWKQIIEYAIENDSIKNIVYITDDTKEDWWEIIESRGEKVIGARPELKDEIYRETEIKNFKIYHNNDFLTDAKKYCGISVDDKAIDEATELLNYTASANFKKLLENYISKIYDLDDYRSSSRVLDEYKSSLSALDEYKSSLIALDEYKSSLSALDEYKSSLSALDEYKSSLSALNDYKSSLSALDEYKSSLSALNDYKSNLSALDEYRYELNNYIKNVSTDNHNKNKDD